mgnify:CR=1 FL=1
MIGNGPLENELRTLSKGANIHIKSEVDNDEVINQMGSSRILLFPSLSEGFPNVLLESMSVGLPSISIAIDNVKEFVIHGENGFLCNRRDYHKYYKYINNLFMFLLLSSIILLI